MTPKEMLIERFKALCEKHGVEVVAERTRSSVDSLKQVIAGTKLPSGKPRGVGPTLQQRLENAFPGWAAMDAAPAPRESLLPLRDGESDLLMLFRLLSAADQHEVLTNVHVLAAASHEQSKAVFARLNLPTPADDQKVADALGGAPKPKRPEPREIPVDALVTRAARAKKVFR